MNVQHLAVRIFVCARKVLLLQELLHIPLHLYVAALLSDSGYLFEALSIAIHMKKENKTSA
jgi:hypothetical protein